MPDWLLSMFFFSALALPTLALAGALARFLLANPRGDVATGLAWRAVQLYVRVVHRARYEGVEHIPSPAEAADAALPLVIVANHAAGIDPLLIQAKLPFMVRWLMLRAMMLPWASTLWEFCDVIPVSPGESRSAREAIRVLKDGGIIGIFPEGGIERPARTLTPFEPGVGLIVSRSGARVLPVFIDVGPKSRHAFASLLIPSRSRVRFLPIRTYHSSKTSAADVLADLEATFTRETGWPRRPIPPAFPSA